jgi:hypothetical protein
MFRVLLLSIWTQPHYPFQTIVADPKGEQVVAVPRRLREPLMHLAIWRQKKHGPV